METKSIIPYELLEKVKTLAESYKYFEIIQIILSKVGLEFNRIEIREIADKDEIFTLFEAK